MSSLENAWQAVQSAFEEAGRESAASARRSLTRDLAGVLRRLRGYEGEDEWVAILLEATSQLTDASGVFAVRGDSFVLRGGRGLSLAAGHCVSRTDAPALAAAVGTRDMVVALRTAKELGPGLGGASAQRALLVPLTNGDRVVAVLFAALEPQTESELVELVATMASVVLERQAKAGGVLQIAAAPRSELPGVADKKKEMPAWTELREEERALHLRAQRYARVRAAEMQLAHPEAAKAGREQNNVYLFLKSDIDAARDSYQSQFLRGEHMVDYLHLELVRTTCDGDEEKLGPDYPGQLG